MFSATPLPLYFNIQYTSSRNSLSLLSPSVLAFQREQPLSVPLHVGMEEGSNGAEGSNSEGLIYLEN